MVFDTEFTYLNHRLKEIGWLLVSSNKIITRRRLCVQGWCMQQFALRQFKTDLRKASAVCGHSVEQDIEVVTRELGYSPFSGKAVVCTAKLAMKRGYTCAPKLVTLHRNVTGEEFTQRHDALEDAEACYRCLRAAVAASWGGLPKVVRRALGAG